MTSRPAWLVGLFAATFALGVDEYVIAGLMPTVASDLGVSVGVAGQLITVFALSFAVGAPVMGVLLDAQRRRPVLLWGLVVFAVVNVLAAVAPSYGVLLLLRVGAGASAAVVSATAFAAAAQGAPHGRQGAFLASVTAGLTVALFTGVPAGAWIGSQFGWRATFVVIAAVAVAATGVVARWLPDLPGVPPVALAERLAPLRRLRVARLVLAVFLCGTGGLMFYSYLAPMVQRVTGDSAALPLVLLLVGVIGIPSALLGGWLADRLGGRGSRLVVIGGHALVLGVLAVLLAVSAPWPAFVMGVGLWSFFAWALNPPLQASTISVAPEAPMGAIALNISGLYLGTAAAGALGGVIVELADERWIPLAGAVLLALAWVSASFRPAPAEAPSPSVAH